MAKYEVIVEIKETVIKTHSVTVFINSNDYHIKDENGNYDNDLIETTAEEWATENCHQWTYVDEESLEIGAVVEEIECTEEDENEEIETYN